MDTRLKQANAAVDAVVNAPLIGLTTSELRRREPLNQQGEPPQVDAALGFAYVEAVTRAGGAPVVIAPLAPAAGETLLRRLDGLLLSGGPDLHPVAYGCEPHEQLGPTEPEVDAFELSLYRSAMALGVPVLGVCRGAQVMNVAEGGTLHQHIPDAYGSQVNHRQPEPGWMCTHAVDPLADSQLSSIVGAGTLMVNSFHHQAIDQLAPGLRPTAHSADGLIEAIERPGDVFCLGVQWHAESLVGEPQQLWLLQAFVAAARRRQAGARPAVHAVASDSLPATVAA